MTNRLTIRKPDDWHLHVRDGEMLKAVLPYTAKNFGRAILMPNLIPPVRTTQDGIAYRERAMAALPKGSTFQPLITCYLTDDTDPDDVERGFKRRRVHRREALSRQRHHQFGRRRHRLSQDHARARTHGKDRHAVPDARRGRRSRRSTSSIARRCSSNAICRNGPSSSPACAWSSNISRPRMASTS